MAYDLFAAPVPVPEARRASMVGLRFDTEAQALDRACMLRKAGWHVYRVSGPDGFEMDQTVIAEYCGCAPRKAS